MLSFGLIRRVHFISIMLLFLPVQDNIASHWRYTCREVISRWQGGTSSSSLILGQFR